MKRTIVIKTEEKDIEIPVKMTLGALRIYRTEFCCDFVDDLEEIHEILHPDPLRQALQGVHINPEEISEEELNKLILSNIDISSIAADTGKQLNANTVEKVMQCVWALNKNADPEAASFGTWIDSFDQMLPAIQLADTCYDLWTESNKTTIELKN